jgi:hypothetical protein
MSQDELIMVVANLMSKLDDISTRLKRLETRKGEKGEKGGILEKERLYKLERLEKKKLRIQNKKKKNLKKLEKLERLEKEKLEKERLGRLEKLEKEKLKLEKERLEKLENKTQKIEETSNDEITNSKCIVITRDNKNKYSVNFSQTQYPFDGYIPERSDCDEKYYYEILRELRHTHLQMPGKFCIQIQPPPRLDCLHPNYYKMNNLRDSVDTYFMKNFNINCKDRIYPFDIIHYHIDVKPELIPIILLEVCDILNNVKFDNLLDIENHMCDDLDNWCWDTATNNTNIIRIDKKYNFATQFINLYVREIPQLNLSYKRYQAKDIGEYKHQGYILLYDDEDYSVYGLGLKKILNRTDIEFMNTAIKTQLNK